MLAKAGDRADDGWRLAKKALSKLGGKADDAPRKVIKSRPRGIPRHIKATKPEKIKIDRNRYPETAAHIEDAQAAGHPKQLTIDRPGAPIRRYEALKVEDKVPGKQLDEYPPAMFEEGGAGASVRPISPPDNMGGGASIGNQLRPLPDG